MMTPKPMIPSRAPRWRLPDGRCVLAAFALLLAQGAAAQTFPQRPMRAIVPFPAGASYDTIMRIVGNAVTESTGQPIVIENRPGASAIIGADTLAKATPDGHTIGMLGNNHTILEALGRKTPYDLYKDFAPLMRIAVLDNVIVVHPSVPAKDMKELVALMRANPDKYRYASGGQGGSTHLAGALIANVAKVRMLHVPYKGGGFAVNGLVGGEVHLMAVNMISAKQHVPSGRLRALAVAAPKRSQHMPEVPTTAEAGFPGAEASQWYGVFAPAGVPAAILKRLEDELRKATARADVRTLLAAQGADAYSETPAELAAFVREDVRINRETAREAGIKSVE
ncbi:MAG: tripartite tricarboxylate transporter substrate binding protein [Rhodocyclaceae bacterium]|nr:tripartite tricarboxylate transporter substrate binding protein [Rhodocyclaceae bacterium]MCA3073096.1 tripartite tricarboxylate transporter substrate binding protein [Rhodocyclaceae bacterium]MCA3091515.1 tripartite tricarboxylate transporter substrate binding protein [Rhodocyclaceae bacterium]MCA3094037.1 tripartite tricarboxylate transporter substrate binding protein [Rhodocyclaceae bacterium]MCA3099172.1 tripartite tricarboxylate transporter substrate binding protein [Rhodocyclaceae bact